MQSEYSDAELVERIAAGANQEAEAELYHRMGPRIRLYGLRHLRDTHAADDLVQQVMITTLQALRAGKLRESERLSSFVLGTCRMIVMDQRRTARRRDQLLTQFGAASAVADSGVSVDRERLAQCVQKLKERERAVVVMTFYDEETGADVARFLGLSEGNIRVMRHRAIHLLRGCMGVAA